MRSISFMPCDELAGDAKRRVPIPSRSKANLKNRRKANTGIERNQIKRRTQHGK